MKIMIKRYYERQRSITDNCYDTEVFAVFIPRIQPISKLFLVKCHNQQYILLGFKSSCYKIKKITVR